mmetsp:Transcript_15052/g.44584  ORF Transcript_15052/g.44584 Transcript_15052/m.44584 type:complete len:226 (-) Transcript_15052:163-840(-)
MRLPSSMSRVRSLPSTATTTPLARNHLPSCTTRTRTPGTTHFVDDGAAFASGGDRGGRSSELPPRLWRRSFVVPATRRKGFCSNSLGSTRTTSARPRMTGAPPASSCASILFSPGTPLALVMRARCATCCLPTMNTTSPGRNCCADSCWRAFLLSSATWASRCFFLSSPWRRTRGSSLSSGGLGVAPSPSRWGRAATASLSSSFFPSHPMPRRSASPNSWMGTAW